jgi:hypothetical protein
VGTHRRERLWLGLYEVVAPTPSMAAARPGIYLRADDRQRGTRANPGGGPLLACHIPNLLEVISNDRIIRPEQHK